jgi:uncharacterized membrane protein
VHNAKINNKEETVSNMQDTFACPLCKVTKLKSESRSAELVHNPVGELIKKDHPDWDAGHTICLSCLNKYRTEYVENVLEEQRGDLSPIENEVLVSMKEQEILARNINPEFDKELSFGARLADRVADFGGSWRFIIIFGSVLVVWIILNSIFLFKRPFDPYPFILLNLVLSCLAAMQAPIIMMSQNRQEAKDRLRAEHDYQVNLKAEIEIRQLHIKLDQLINHSWQRLLEIQRIQLELMEEVSHKTEHDKT